jgi:hypothetical protein
MEKELTVKQEEKELTVKQEKFRKELVDRLRLDLMGPTAPDELIQDRPTDRYMTGILYPQESAISVEEDEGLGIAGSDDEAAVEEAVPLISTMKPSSVGISFSVEGPSPAIQTHVRCGVYRVEGSEKSDANTRQWRRTALNTTVALALEPGVAEEVLEAHGIRGLKLYVQVSPADRGSRNVTVALVNLQARGETRTESEERTFFQVEVEVCPSPGTTFVARPSRKHAIDEDGRAARLIYRDAEEIATGHTCAAAWDVKDRIVTAVRTEWLPTAVVPAVSPLGDESFRSITAGEKLDAAWLASAPPSELVAALRELVAAYRAWIEDSRGRVTKLPEELQGQARSHLEECERGATRMGVSIEAIESMPAVRRAFQLSQNAMDVQRRWTEAKPLKWRPFQLGFQLLVLAGLADRHHSDREVMDLLWFPTGGGKTEAYLALTAFTFFIRRLQATAPDDGAGVAVLMRYTLRLLTVQQFQRAAVMVLACEHLRRREGGLGTTPFSIGLWVGNSATPGTIADAMTNKSGATHKQLTSCPCCKGRLEWDFPKRVSRVRCAGTDPCELRFPKDEGLPVWTIDEDVYRETPSLLIGTVDKFAQIVRKQESGSLFARGSSRMPPDLVIQDELHLISGPLGTVTGLYETAIDELCAQKGARPKVIGSTATIRRAHDQITALFARRAFQFPPPGLDDSSSGFAVVDTEQPGRLYLGLSTAGRSAKYAVQAVAGAVLQAVGARSDVPTDVRDPYWTLVTYFNTLRELGGSLVLMQDDVPITMQQFAGRHHPETARNVGLPAELTSRVSSGQIRSMLDELAIRYDKPGALDILLASNMISVGVDIPRLGVMMVVGQPKTISEYIQATSRVGRRSPGLVIALYNAGRVRDRAHFETFATWHRTLYREVEATSVTPFASRSQDKALHAVLVALVRHLVPGMGDRPRLTRAARADAERLVQRIEERVRIVDQGEQKAVGERLRKFLDAWEAETDLEKYWDDYGQHRSLLMSAEQHAAVKAIGGTANRAWPTPNSMREVEPGVPFMLLEKLRSQGGSDAE